LDDLQYSLLTLFADGGPMMYALVLCSLVALGVIIAKAWTLWVAHRDTDTILAEVKELTYAGQFEEAIQRCIDTPGPTSPRSSSPAPPHQGRQGAGGRAGAGDRHHRQHRAGIPRAGPRDSRDDRECRAAHGLPRYGGRHDHGVRLDRDGRRRGSDPGGRGDQGGAAHHRDRVCSSPFPRTSVTTSS
jgi:hypothetical protein